MLSGIYGEHLDQAIRLLGPPEQDPDEFDDTYFDDVLEHIRMEETSGVLSEGASGLTAKIRSWKKKDEKGNLVFDKDGKQTIEYEDYPTIGYGHYMEPERSQDIFSRSEALRYLDWDALERSDISLTPQQAETLFHLDVRDKMEIAQKLWPTILSPNLPDELKIQAYGLWFQGPLADSPKTRHKLDQALQGERPFGDAALEFLDRSDYRVSLEPGRDRRYEDFALLIWNLDPPEMKFFDLAGAIEQGIRPVASGKDENRRVEWAQPGGELLPPLIISGTISNYFLKVQQDLDSLPDDLSLKEARAQQRIGGRAPEWEFTGLDNLLAENPKATVGDAKRAYKPIRVTKEVRALEPSYELLPGKEAELDSIHKQLKKLNQSNLGSVDRTYWDSEHRSKLIDLKIRKDSLFKITFPTLHERSEPPGGQLPGYRELTVTWDNPDRSPEEVRLLRRLRLLREDMFVVGRDPLVGSIIGDREWEVEQIEKRLEELGSSPPRFREGHFGEDVMYHVRFGDAVSPHGGRELVVMEIQSDWSAAARRSYHTGWAAGYAGKRGFVGERVPYPPRAVYVVDEVPIEDRKPGKNQVSLRALGDLGEHVPRIEIEAPHIKAIAEATGVTIDPLDRLGSGLEVKGEHLSRQGLTKAGTIPRFPMMSDWPEQAVRDMFKLAADEGYDSVRFLDAKEVAYMSDIAEKSKLYTERIPKAAERIAAKAGVASRIRIEEVIPVDPYLHPDEHLVKWFNINPESRAILGQPEPLFRRLRGFAAVPWMLAPDLLTDPAMVAANWAKKQNIGDIAFETEKAQPFYTEGTRRRAYIEEHGTPAQVAWLEESIANRGKFWSEGHDLPAHGLGILAPITTWFTGYGGNTPMDSIYKEVRRNKYEEDNRRYNAGLGLVSRYGINPEPEQAPKPRGRVY